MAANPKFRILYVIWAFLECLLFGGLLYGWGSLVYILIEDGIYSELCLEKSLESLHSNVSTVVVDTVETSTSLTANYSIAGNSSDNEGKVKGLTIDNPSCADRGKRLTLVFTIGSMMFCAGCAVMGQINFKFGTRMTRLCALTCFTAGALMTGFTNRDIPWLIFPGLSLLGIGGIPILMTNIQFSMLFTKGSSTVVSMLSGSFDASSGVMLIVKLLYEDGFALHWSMLVITIAHLLTLVNTFFFLPRGFISKPTPTLIREDPIEDESGVELVTKSTPKSELGNVDEKEAFKEQSKEKELPSIKSCVISPGYFLHVIWLSILQLRFYYFLGSLNTWLNSLFSSKEDVSHYTNVCMYAMMCGLITSPCAGLIYDICKRVFATSRSQICRDLMPSVIPLAMTSLLGIILSVLVLMDNVDILYPTFIFNTMFRSFIYSMGAAYIGVIFPSEYFGILYGLMIILSGVISLAQYGLFSWAEASGFFSVNGFLIAFVATSLVHPLFQWYTCRRAEAQVVIAEE